MTDPTALTDDDLSLALDGEADADLLARIDADPDAQARLAELRAATDLIGAPVAPLDDDTVDSLITTALDTPVAPPRVAAGGRRRATPWLVAASVVVLMAIGLSLVWAGRGSEDDQAGASRTAADQQAESTGDTDSSFSEGAGASEANDDAAAAPLTGGHGTETTIASAAAADLPIVYLGSYPSADALREATATSFADALKASRSSLSYDPTDPTDEQTATEERAMGKVPSAPSVDRCAQQLQVTLSLKAGPLQTGYGTVDDKAVLVYEFPATSARDGKETTLVAAVGTEACDEVVIFER